jgi:hypothetical protein
MPTSTARLASILLLSGLAACGSSTTKKSVGSLTVTASPTRIRADGAATSLVHVAGATVTPIRITASRGSFVESSTGTVQVDATVADVTLVACDGADSTCKTSIVVSAVDGAFASGSATVSLIARETVCNDGLDNNADGNADCADADCNLQACRTSTGAAGTCSANVCVAAVCTPNETPETTCNNGVDDDCDSLVDCADTDCDGRQCGATATSVCQNQACVDLAAGVGLSMATARSRLPADGIATTAVDVTVTQGGAPQGGIQVTLQTTLGTFVGAPAPGTSVTVSTDSAGTASARFQASAAAGTATITASLAAVPLLTATAQIAVPALGSIQVASVQNPVMGVKYSGFNEQNAISVLLLDTEQKPYPDGLQVEFEHLPLGGSQISTPWTDLGGCAVPACLRYLGATESPPDKPDSEGLARVNLYSGTAAGPVSIQVRATAAGTTRSFTVQNIAVVGAKAAHVSVACTPLNVPAFIYDDCTNSFYGGPDALITCTVFLADRFNNVVGVPTRAEFRSEAGSGFSSVLTAGYDPAKGGDQTADLGHASATISVSGYKLPADVDPLTVDPFTGNPEHSLDYNSGCGTKRHNPRDGLATVMVAVQGEELFVDRNGNGVYDAGEPFVDQGEPFVDENDDNLRTGDEYFIDVNQNGAWDGPNDVWDGDAVIWAEARVVYTGLPAFPASRWVAPADAGALPGPTPPAAFIVDSSSPGPATSETFDVFFTDLNFNAITPKATYEVTSDLGNVDVKLLTTPNTVDNLGMSFTQRFCDGSPAATPPTAPANCFSTCQSAPCYRITQVGSFRYGILLPALITGGGNPATVDVVRGSATVEGIKSDVIISGTVN